MPNFLHNFYLLTSNVSRLGYWQSDLYESYSSSRIFYNADFLYSFNADLVSNSQARMPDRDSQL